MANKHLYKYTDENYLTRAGLRLAMHSSLIDNFWLEILEYRRANAEKTPLLGMNRSRLSLTKTEATSARFANFEKRLSAYSNAISDLCLNPSAEKTFAKENYLEVIGASSKLLGESVTELSAKAMVNGFYKPSNNEKEATIGRYFNLLKAEAKSPSEDSLGELRFSLLGRDDVSSFYRSSDFRSIYTTQLVARDYTYAPYGEIEGMMESLFSFLSSSSYEIGMKCLLCLYYVYIVKPFEENNELLASVFAKSVLSSSGIAGASYLPFESLLQDSSALKDVLGEVQAQKDLTFFLFYCIERLNTFFDRSLARLNELKNETVRKEFVEIPKEEKEESAPPSEAIPSPEPEEKEPPKEKESKPTKVPLLSEEERKAFLQSKGRSAFSSPGPSLSDKEVKETAKYLLETNPLLRKKQALFYASHCTLGRFYTIQDFKKATRCAYETARTSMDGLAELGFYQKKQIKNKFVYTPINQGETK